MVFACVFFKYNQEIQETYHFLMVSDFRGVYIYLLYHMIYVYVYIVYTSLETVHIKFKCIFSHFLLRTLSSSIG